MMTISEFDQEIEDNLPTAAENEAFFNTRFQCRHIFTQGHRCRSACLRGEEFCYHHHTTRVPVYNARQRRARQSTALATGQSGPLELPMPEDHAAIGLAAGQIMHAIAANTIDIRRAGMMLYALQIANCALPRQAAKSPSENDMEDQAVDEIVHHPDLGIIALEMDFVEEEEEFLGPGGRRFEEQERQYELTMLNKRIRELEARLSGYEPVTSTVDLKASHAPQPLDFEMVEPAPSPSCRCTSKNSDRLPRTRSPRPLSLPPRLLLSYQSHLNVTGKRRPNRPERRTDLRAQPLHGSHRSKADEGRHQGIFDQVLP